MTNSNEVYTKEILKMCTHCTVCGTLSIAKSTVTGLALATAKKSQPLKKSLKMTDMISSTNKRNILKSWI